MAKNKSEEIRKIEPTKSELEILQVLWQHGPSTVRFVMEELNKIRELNYTATLKLMQLMVDKGILKRDESKMQHIYHIVEAEDKTKERLLDRFLDTLYHGSAANLMIHLVGNKRMSTADLKMMKDLLDNLEKTQKA
jgi:predicted transcriptional regulator